MGKGEGGWRDGTGRGKGQFSSSCSSCSSARSSSVQGFVCCLFCWRLRSDAGINGEGGRGQAGLGGRGRDSSILVLIIILVLLLPLFRCRGLFIVVCLLFVSVPQLKL